MKFWKRFFVAGPPPRLGAPDKKAPLGGSKPEGAAWGPFFAAGLACLGFSAAVSAQDVLRFGTAGQLSNESIALAIAIEKGYLKDEGIEAELVHFKGGAPAIQALVGKAIQLCVCAPEHVIRLRNRGVDATVVVPLDNVTGYALLGGKEETARSLEALRGKRLGITSSGSKTDNLVRLAIQRLGLDPDGDFRIVSIGGTSNVLAGLQTGNIEAGMIAGVDALLAERDGYPVVYDWRTRPVPNLGLLGLESWASSNPELAHRLTRAILRAARESIEDRGLRVEALRQLYPKAEPALIELAADRLVHSTVAAPRFSAEEFEGLQRDVLELEPALKPITYAQFGQDFSR